MEESVKNPFVIQLEHLERPLALDVSDVELECVEAGEELSLLHELVAIAECIPTPSSNILSYIERLHSWIEHTIDFLRSRFALDDEDLILPPVNIWLIHEIHANPAAGLEMRGIWFDNILLRVADRLSERALDTWSKLSCMEKTLKDLKDEHAKLLSYASSPCVCKALAKLHEAGGVPQTSNYNFIGVDLDTSLQSVETAAAFHASRELLLFANAMSKVSEGRPRQTTLHEYWGNYTPYTDEPYKFKPMDAVDTGIGS